MHYMKEDRGSETEILRVDQQINNKWFWFGVRVFFFCCCNIFWLTNSSVRVAWWINFYDLWSATVNRLDLRQKEKKKKKYFSNFDGAPIIELWIKTRVYCAAEQPPHTRTLAYAQHKCRARCVCWASTQGTERDQIISRAFSHMWVCGHLLLTTWINRTALNSISDSVNRLLLSIFETVRLLSVPFKQSVCQMVAIFLNNLKSYIY